MAKFEKGDVVRLKSDLKGEFPMTVYSYLQEGPYGIKYDEPTVECVQMKEDGPEYHTLAEALLERI